MRKKEIGGYFELEESSGQEYYPELYRFNLGRTALLFLLEELQIKKLWLPYFLCDSVTSRCGETGCQLQFYHIHSDFSPDLDIQPAADEYVYLVNYYGQLTDASIRFYQKKFRRIIVDHTHAFFQAPLPGVPTIYSCRKFFGLPDGAYLSADIQPSSLPDMDTSFRRMEHILGRYEEDASTYYGILHKNADTFYQEPVKTMSRLTHNLLKSIDYPKARKKRQENYHYLQETLGAYSGKSFLTPEGPFCFPFYTDRGPELRKALASQKIYVPTYWGNVLEEMPKNSVEYDMAANILALPCDHRYDTEDMEAVANAVIHFLQKSENPS